MLSASDSGDLVMVNGMNVGSDQSSDRPHGVDLQSKPIEGGQVAFVAGDEIPTWGKQNAAWNLTDPETHQHDAAQLAS